MQRPHDYTDRLLRLMASQPDAASALATLLSDDASVKKRYTALKTTLHWATILDTDLRETTAMTAGELAGSVVTATQNRERIAKYYAKKVLALEAIANNKGE